MIGRGSARADRSGEQAEGAASGAAADEFRFVPHDRSADASLVEFLTGSDWPFHPEPRLDHAVVLRRLGDGDFDTSGDQNLAIDSGLYAVASGSGWW